MADLGSSFMLPSAPVMDQGSINGAVVVDIHGLPIYAIHVTLFRTFTLILSFIDEYFIQTCGSENSDVEGIGGLTKTWLPGQPSSVDGSCGRRNPIIKPP